MNAIRRIGIAIMALGPWVSEALWVVAMVFCVLAGCATTPDALRLAVVANNEAVHLLREATEKHEAALEADAERRVETCRAEPPEDRGECVRFAVLAAFDAAKSEREQLTILSLTQQQAADSLTAAAQCRLDGADCETKELAQAQSALARVRAGVRALLGGGGRL